jgi:hypothetical protein
MFGHINSIRYLISDTIKSKPNFIRNKRKGHMKLKFKLLVLVLCWGLHIFQMVRVTPNMQVFSHEINDKCNTNALTSNNIRYSVMSGNLSFILTNHMQDSLRY